MLKKGDIVEWTVIGSGGPGYVIGKLTCKVAYDEEHQDVGLIPLDWNEAWELLSGELDFTDVAESYKYGCWENCQTTDCKLLCSLKERFLDPDTKYPLTHVEEKNLIIALPKELTL